MPRRRKRKHKMKNEKEAEVTAISSLDEKFQSYLRFHHGHCFCCKVEIDGRGNAAGLNTLEDFDGSSFCKDCSSGAHRGHLDTAEDRYLLTEFCVICQKLAPTIILSRYDAMLQWRVANSGRPNWCGHCKTTSVVFFFSNAVDDAVLKPSLAYWGTKHEGPGSRALAIISGLTGKVREAEEVTERLPEGWEEKQVIKTGVETECGGYQSRTYWAT